MISPGGGALCRRNVIPGFWGAGGANLSTVRLGWEPGAWSRELGAGAGSLWRCSRAGKLIESAGLSRWIRQHSSGLVVRSHRWGDCGTGGRACGRSRFPKRVNRFWLRYRRLEGGIHSFDSSTVGAFATCCGVNLAVWRRRVASRGFRGEGTAKFRVADHAATTESTDRYSTHYSTGTRE